MLFLGIESTAHTFGASMIDDQGRIVTNVNSTYRPPTGIGIHPRKAAEHHNEVSSGVIEKALQGVGDRASPDAVCYSAGPGLGPCLRIGATISRALALYLDKPLVPVHHGVAHLDLAMAAGHSHDPLAVLVSGGHTAIAVHLNKRWRIYGETEDITLGNLLDMFAREAGLPSPGGPPIESKANEGRNLLPLPYTVKGNDVAYSGLLTAANRLLKQGHSIADICFSIQEVSFSMLAEAVERSLVQTRKERTIKESSAIRDAKIAGARLPSILGLDIERSTIIMTFIDGVLARDSIDTMSNTRRISLLEELGRQVGFLHSAGIMHGDLTTSNIIVPADEKPFMIDFGMARKSTDHEDHGSDLHLLQRSLIATHALDAPSLLRRVAKGYREVVGEEMAKSSLRKAAEIARRGRYFAIR